MKRQWLAILIAIIAAIGNMARAEWETVAPGITCRSFSLDGPVMVYVARADRSTGDWIIDSCIGGGTLYSGRETVSELARRYDDSVNFDGTRYDVKVAINGDYFSFQTGQSAGGQIISGWFVKRFVDYAGGSGFVWGLDRTCRLGGNVRNGKRWQRALFADSADMPITNINTTRGENELVLYTSHYATTTRTPPAGVEVVVHMPERLGVTRAPGSVTGTIVELREQAGSTPLPFDHVVLSGHGSAARMLIEHARVGQEVAIHLGMKDDGLGEVEAADWTKAWASIAGHFYCVVKGRVPADRWESKGKPGAINRHPRTAVAFNDAFVFFIVADGRSEQSVGMTITELGNFCADHLSASYAIAQDGGGSSTMWIDGKVVNVPSDNGQERPVANGYLMVVPVEPERSGALTAGSTVQTGQPVDLRLGPGTNFGLAGRADAGQEGTVIEHRLNGICAKGQYWWKSRFNKLEGWMALPPTTSRTSNTQPQ